MTIQQFEEFLGDIQDDLSNLDKILLPEVNRIVSQLKSDAPVAEQNGGALRDSIRARIVGENIEFQMLSYGIPQNYGVRGTVSNYGAMVIEDGIPGAGSTMQFGAKTIGGNLPFAVRKSIAEKGLRPQEWFSLEDITNQIVDQLQNNIAPDGN